MGRRREVDLGLPPRVYPKHNADGEITSYVYRPRNGKAVALGRTILEAITEYGRLSKTGLTEQMRVKIGTVRAVINDYRVFELSKLSEETKLTYDPLLNKIDVVLGDLPPRALDIDAMNAFIDGVTQSDHTRNTLVSLFRNLFKLAKKKGLVKQNTARELDKEPVEARGRVPEPAELEAFKAAQARHGRVDAVWWSCYIDLKLLTGLRQKDLLALPLIPLDQPIFSHEMSKSKRWRKSAGARVGRQITFEVTDDVRGVLKRLYGLPRPQRATHLLCNRFGRPFPSSSFKKSWYRAMQRYLATLGEAEVEKGIKSAYWFHEHDIRATVASVDEENARARLGHKSQKTTDLYIRELLSAKVAKPVKPLSLEALQSLSSAVKPSQNIHQLKTENSK